MANLRKGSGPNRPRPSQKKSKNNSDTWIAGLGAGCIGFLVLLKLAMIGGAFYLAYLVVAWLITK